MSVVPLPSREPEDLAVRSEAALQARILRLCQQFRLRWFHSYNGQVALPGFPDLVIAGPGGVVFWELKSPFGELSEQQEIWAEALKAAGADYSVVRPSNWCSGQVETKLEALAEDEFGEEAA